MPLHNFERSGKPILAQMSMPAQRGRMGEDRTFTYEFADGSRLILAARPQGGGRGLILYYVDIQEGAAMSKQAAAD